MWSEVVLLHQVALMITTDIIPTIIIKEQKYNDSFIYIILLINIKGPILCYFLYLFNFIDCQNRDILLCNSKLCASVKTVTC